MLESKSYIATPTGATIKEQLGNRGMTQKEFANRMGMSEKHISRLINGEVHLTPETAEKLEMVLGVPASFWNKLEAIYQEKLAKVKSENEMEKEKKLAAKYPYNKIASWGMVPKTADWKKKIINLCKYFEVSSLKLLQNKELMPVACRKLSDTEKSTYIMMTLAQYAKIKARGIQTEPFCKETLQEKLKDIRALTMHQTRDFDDELAGILKSCGVALVYLPKIEGSFLHGISFYDNNTDKIVIGVTMRGKYADRFWFSLFHELSHVLKGHIYQREGTTDEDEKQADAMAAEILIPSERLKGFYQKQDYSFGAIQQLAESVKVGIGIVIGRLQNDRKIKQNQLNQYKIKYDDKAS